MASFHTYRGFVYKFHWLHSRFVIPAQAGMTLNSYKQKTPSHWTGFSVNTNWCLSLTRRGDAHKLAVLRALGLKRNHTVYLGKQGVIMTTAHVDAGMKLGATLADDNVTRPDSLTTEAFHTKAFGM